MKPLAEQQLHTGVFNALLALREAEGKLKSLLQATQAECDHRFVVECEYKRMQFFPFLPAMRTCLHCRLETSAEHLFSGFGRLEDTEGRVVTPIDRDDLMRLRIET